LASVPTDPLADVPLLVRLDPARFSYEHAKSDGSDLRFVGEDGTELAHEIEGWDADGDSWIWVRIPSVNAVGQRFYLYFDNASADAPEAAASVWSNEYLTVLHLSDELADSVGTVDLVDSNTFVGFGQVGLSRVFTINEAQIALSDDDALDDLYSTGVTISGWIRVDRLDSWQVFMGKCDDPYDPFEGSILVADGSWAAIWGHDIDATGHWWGTSPLVEAQWHWFAISFDPADWGGSFIMVDDTITRFDYWDDVGADVLTSDAAFPFVLAPQNTVDTSAFLGALDEVRIAAAPRSLAWLTFQRLSMRDELLEFGPVQTVPPCVP
jgi:hypothetical protein